MYLPILLAFAEEAASHELFMPAPWFGILVFLVLMFALLITLAFSNKNRQLPPQSHSDH